MIRYREVMKNKQLIFLDKVCRFFTYCIVMNVDKDGNVISFQLSKSSKFA